MDIFNVLCFDPYEDVMMAMDLAHMNKILAMLYGNQSNTKFPATLQQNHACTGFGSSPIRGPDLKLLVLTEDLYRYQYGQEDTVNNVKGTVNSLQATVNNMNGTTRRDLDARQFPGASVSRSE